MKIKAFARDNSGWIVEIQSIVESPCKKWCITRDGKLYAVNHVNSGIAVKSKIETIDKAKKDMIILAGISINDILVGDMSTDELIANAHALADKYKAQVDEEIVEEYREILTRNIKRIVKIIENEEL